MYLFAPTVVLDPVSGALVKGSQGEIFAAGDVAGTNPLEVTLLDGLVRDVVRVGEVGLTEAFYATEPSVVWMAGGISVPLFSFEALLRLAEETLAAAQAAGEKAQDAVDLAGGKNKVWPPSLVAPADPNVGDLWTDEGDNRALKQWNGSTWALVQDFDGVATEILDQIRADITEAEASLEVVETVTIPELRFSVDEAAASVATLTDLTIPALEQALQDAEAAIETTLPGAITEAANAAALASRLLTISTSAPVVGDGANKPVGAIWERVNSLTGTSAVIARWRWSGSAWVVTTIDPTYIPNLAAAKITSGTIATARLNATEIAVAVASVIELNASRITAGTVNTARLDATEIAAAVATIISLNADRITAGTINTARLNASQVAAAVGEFLSLTAGQITSGTIATARLDALEIAAAVATVIELNASRITTGQLTGARISGDAIDGKTVTGATVQSSALANRGVKMDSGGLRAFSNTGVRTVNIDSATGAAEFVGGFKTATTGRRIELGPDPVTPGRGALTVFDETNILRGRISISDAGQMNVDSTTMILRGANSVSVQAGGTGGEIFFRFYGIFQMSTYKRWNNGAGRWETLFNGVWYPEQGVVAYFRAAAFNYTGTALLLPWDGVESNPGYFSYDAAAREFVCQVSGTYAIEARVNFQAAGSVIPAQSSLMRNGSVIQNADGATAASGGSSNLLSRTVNLVNADRISLRTYAAGTIAIQTGDANTRIQITRLAV